jgi:hypothetical protein
LRISVTYYMENTPRRIYPEIENLTALLDDKFELFGFRFGISLLIDLVPGIGDVISPVLDLYIFSMAAKYKISGWTKFLMLLNIGVSFLIGLIPIIGDLWAAWWKPNRRNLKLLQKALDKM